MESTQCTTELACLLVYGLTWLLGQPSCGLGKDEVVSLLKPGTLKTWVYTLHACNGIINEMNDKELPSEHLPESNEIGVCLEKN